MAKNERAPALVKFLLTLAIWVGGCAGDDSSLVDGASPQDLDCQLAREGCPCETEDEIRDCGEVEQAGVKTVTCALGERICQAGVWSGCSFDRRGVVERDTIQPAALGAPRSCDANFDVCDPYCHLTTDSAGGFDAGAGFSNNAMTGLTLVGTYTPMCNSLTLTPSRTTVTMSGSSFSSLSTAPITFTLTASPSGCAGIGAFPTTWVVDRFDRASVAGSTSTNGSLTIAAPIAGPLVVTAYAAGLSASRTINVKINVLDAPTMTTAATPNVPATSQRINAFGTLTSPNAGTTSTTATWLYPYQGTWLPLALPAPVVQYSYARGTSDSTTTGSSVKVSLRYPANSTATNAAFNYSLIVRENNSVTCADNSANCNFLDPQITLPPSAWRYFELSARGEDALLSVQRLREQSNGTALLETESTRTIHFVDGQLKGTVYYNSYTSPQAGYTGAILSIEPGALSPTVAVAPGGTCSTCHSINDDGTRLITNGGKNPNNSYNYDISQLYDMTTPGPSPTSQASYTDNRFTYGGPWLNGAYYISHGAGTEWHAPGGSSGFYAVTNSSTPVAVNGWPTDVQGYTPRFSPDGTKLAFTFRGGSSLSCVNSSLSPCSGSPRRLANASTMTRMAVVDFSCATPPCNAGSTGFRVANARDVTPNFTDRVAWPSFSPDSNIVAYQKQIRSSKAIIDWSASDVGSIAGAQAEVWGTVVPVDGRTAAVPARYNRLNGLDSSGTSYLPSRARSLIEDSAPLYSFRINRHEMVRTGIVSPNVGLTGVPTGVWDVRIDIVGLGTRGVATFRYSTNGGTSWSGNLVTAADVPLGSTGLIAQFPTGIYDPASDYKALTGRVRVVGTPVTSNQDVRIKIDTTGARGTARFRYSMNGGTNYSNQLTTAARVPLGTTGLVAEFDSVNYESTSWVWGTLVSHPHEDNATYTILRSDQCSSSGTMSGVRDSQSNFYPSFAPTLVGGKSWVLFTSRRMFGNVAVQDGWDPQSNQSCSSGKIPSKKLWVAAVDPDASPGVDPSYPAFYLPGQEIDAGNSDGYWVGEACTAVEGSCETDDDCCGGTGAQQTTQCRVISTATYPPQKVCKARNLCADVGHSCSTSSDCCSGLLCPNGGGLCYRSPPLLFEDQTITREYVAECPKATTPAWRFFEWQSTIPAGTSIEFFAQTRENTTDPWRPAAPILTGTANQTSNTNQWFRGPLPTSSLLEQARLGNRRRLLVTMIFHPDSTRTVAPTLHNWRQIYDCLPGE